MTDPNESTALWSAAPAWRGRRLDNLIHGVLGVHQCIVLVLGEQEVEYLQKSSSELLH